MTCASRIALVLACLALATPASAQTGDGPASPEEASGDDAPAPTGDVPAPPGEETEEEPPPELADIDEPDEEPVDPAARMRMLVIDSATFGIDPVVGRVASAVMRETGASMGYHVLTQPETVAAAQQLRMPYPPTPADLWRVSWVGRVHRGSFARIWAHAGQYVIEITVASLDGAGPFFARGTAGADDLRTVIDRLFRTALPAPSVWTQARSAGGGQDPAETPLNELDGPRQQTDDPSGEAGRSTEPGEDEEPEPELRRWSLTIQTEAAFGVSSEFFYNHLVGARIDFRITRSIIIGAYFAYANLNERNGRADNLLFMLQFEDRIRLSDDLDLTIPLRAAVGYVPFNGPVIRLAAGLNYAVSPDWEIGADLLVPTFWILADGGTAVSLDVAVEVTRRF